jgi:hypothetical protein
MAIRHGMYAQVYFHHVGFGSVGLHQKGNVANFGWNAPAADVTTLGSVAKSFIVGQYGASFDMAGFVDTPAAADALGSINPDGAFATALMSGTAGTVWYLPEGTVTGKPIYKFVSFVTDYKCTSNLSGGVSYTATMQPSGTIDRSTAA